MAERAWAPNPGTTNKLPDGDITEIKLRDGRVVEVAKLRFGTIELYWRHDDVPHDIMEYR